MNVIEDIAIGQKIVIYSIIANFISNAIIRNNDIGMMASLVTFVIACATLYGVFRLCTGLQYSTGLKIGMIILMFIPLINIITLVVLSIKGSKRLKESRYEVGFFGVKK